MTRVEGSGVVLRAFHEDELDQLVEVAATTPVGDGAHWGPRGRDELRARIRESGVWTPSGVLTFAVEQGGRLVGDVQARTARGAMPPGVFELGIEVFDETDRGRGLGAAALAELSSHLFREEAAIRVQLTTDVANAAMRRVAERLGFGFEGVLRGFMPTDDGPRDYAIYGLTRRDWETKKDAWTRTS